MDASGHACGRLKIGAFNVRIFPPVKILAARPEDSGTYVCTARSSGGSTETKVEVIVEGKPRASVPEPQMVVVEGRSATLRCHAHGKMTRCILVSRFPDDPVSDPFRCNRDRWARSAHHPNFSRFSGPCDQLVQATLSAAMETQSGERQFGVAQRGPPRFWRIRLQSVQQHGRQPGHHQAGC